MKIRPLMLTPTFAKNVKAPGRYGDGRGGLGLSLLVRPASRGGFNKSWTQSVRIGGRPTSLGLGRYPVVTLAMARERALENARAIAMGRDPRGGTRGVPTFAEALEAVIAINAEHWKGGGGSEHHWRATMGAYALPAIGAKAVDEVTAADVMGHRRADLVHQARHRQAGTAADRRGDEVGGGAGPPPGQPRRGTPWGRRCRRSAGRRGTSGRCRTPKWARRWSACAGPTRPPPSGWRSSSWC